MRFFGCAVLHGFVVGMQAGIVVDFEGGGVESFCNLSEY